VDEQRQIVARVETIAARVEEAQRLRREAIEEGSALLRSMLFGAASARPTLLANLLDLRPPDVRVEADGSYQFAGVYSFGRGVFVGELKQGMTVSYPRLTRLRAGDFVYPKLMAWEGAFGIVPLEAEGCVVSTEFPVFTIRTDQVRPEVIETYFKTPGIWESLAGSATGTNVRRRRLHPDKLLASRISLPAMADQSRLAETARSLSVIDQVRTESAPEWAALLPSVLDRAIKGEL
jgi:type I restriction enzyme S subunit